MSFIAMGLSVGAVFASLLAAGDTEARTPPLPKDREALVVTQQIDDGVYVATRPELFSGKAVRIFCERLRNPDWVSISCWVGNTSIVVDTRLLDAEVLRHAHTNCRGMQSSCRGMVMGIAEYHRGVPRITNAEIRFAAD